MGSVPADCTGGHCAPLIQFEHHRVHQRVHPGTYDRPRSFGAGHPKYGADPPLAVLLAGFLIVDWGITYTALFYAVFILLSLVVMVFQKPLRQLPHISQVTNAQ